MQSSGADAGNSFQRAADAIWSSTHVGTRPVRSLCLRVMIYFATELTLLYGNVLSFIIVYSSFLALLLWVFLFVVFARREPTDSRMLFFSHSPAEYSKGWAFGWQKASLAGRLGTLCYSSDNTRHDSNTYVGVLNTNISVLDEIFSFTVII